jgi:ribosomal protein S19E (S16A)
MKSVSGRNLELARIAQKGVEITCADTGFIAPNRWLSRDLIIEFEARGLIERRGKRARVTPKGERLLEGKTNG